MDEYDQRDVLWEEIYNVYYDTYYQELLADYMMSLWLSFDEITKIIVAVTASTSAISGWALWESQVGRVVWMFLAAIAALLSVVHSTLNVTSRVRDWTETKRNFSSLKIELEIIRSELSANPDFSITDYMKVYSTQHKKYGELYSNLKRDILLSKKIRLKVQSELNELLKNITSVNDA